MRGYLPEAGFCIAVFLVVTGVADLLGAANLGTAATFGQLAFVAALAYVMLGRRRG